MNYYKIRNKDLVPTIVVEDGIDRKKSVAVLKISINSSCSKCEDTDETSHIGTGNKTSFTRRNHDNLPQGIFLKLTASKLVGFKPETYKKLKESFYGLNVHVFCKIFNIFEWVTGSFNDKNNEIEFCTFPHYYV